MKPSINTCFVISPISDDGSEIRKEADKLLWLIRNVSEKHAFSAVRVDEVSGTTVITDEIKNFITKSGMCVCVLTESNPNVFYETGLRHSTGKPYIHLMRKGNDIPFDLKGISTIFYGDLNSFEEVRSLTEKLDSFFVAEKSKVTEAEERDKLDIILDVLKSLSSKMDVMREVAAHQRTSLDLEPYLGSNPTESFLLAVAQSDQHNAEAFFEKTLQFLETPRQRLAAAQRLAIIGSQVGIDYILQHYKEDPDLTAAETCALLSGLVEKVGSKYPEKIDAVIAVLDPIAASGDRDAAIAALNQKQRLVYSAGRYEAAMEIIESILAIVSDDPSYFHNASVIYEKLGLVQKAKSAIDKMLALGPTEDEDHLSQAIDIYVAVGELDKARELYATLKEHHPRRAAIKALDPDFRKKVGLSKR